MKYYQSFLENKFLTQQIINQVEKNVSNLQNSTPFKINQNVEFHSKINSHHIISFLGIFEYNRNHYLEKWSTPDQFLSGILETYPNQNLNQIYENKLVDKKLMFLESKYFWTINPYNQLIVNLNSRFNSVYLKTNSFQKLDNNNIFEFSDEFQNLGNHSLFQNELGLYYKWRYKKWIVNQGFKLSNYAEKSRYSVMDISQSKWNLLPSILIEYGKKTNNKWGLKYEQNYKLSNDEQKYIGYTISTYRAVNKGNIDLNESQYHVFSTQYYKSSVLKKYYFKFDVKYSFQTQGFIKEVVLNGTSQINSNIFHLNPAKSLIVNLNASKQKNKLKFSLNFNFSNLENLMSINSEKLNIIGNRLNYGLKTQTLFKKIPNFDFTYNYITNQNNFISNNKQIQHELNIKADHTFKSGVSLSLENNLNIYDDFSGNTINYNLFHFKTFYVTKSKLWQYEISAKNVLNVDRKYLNINNDFYKSESYYNTFPSLWLITIARKF